jgi:hypothetical protein
MKQIFSPNYAFVEAEEKMIINHPTTIFTDDAIPVTTFDTEDELNYHISQKEPDDFPVLPNEGEWCERNVIYAYGNKMAKCLQSHNRMHFTPEKTPALFLIIEPTGADYPVWRQPTGAHDAYRKGDKVHFPTMADPVYESKIDANVWSPTVYPEGWKKL